MLLGGSDPQRRFGSDSVFCNVVRFFIEAGLAAGATADNGGPCPDF